ncbi:transposable element Tc1 transposase [Trichonephila clavipes]|nr:transposable element Tc1 transposase [Trichonephila clavipes]
MVWAGIMINDRTRLHVVANGTMTGQRYIDEVLLHHDCLDSEGIQRLVWPARSPDLKPIETVWDALGRQVSGRNYPPTNKNTLIRALTEEWDKFPQQLLDYVVQSMVLFAFLSIFQPPPKPNANRKTSLKVVYFNKLMFNLGQPIKRDSSGEASENVCQERSAINHRPSE